MSVSQVLEVGIGLSVVYYVLGLIVSFITTRINEILDTRGKVLRDYLNQIVGDQSVDELLKAPQIKSLAPVRYKGLLGSITGKTETRPVEKIPVSNLVDAVFDHLGVIGGKQYEIQELKDLLSQLPESDERNKLLDLITRGETTVEQIRSKVTQWYDGLLNQASAEFKAKARQIVVLLSLIVTVIFAVDTIDLATQLWNSSNLRTLANAEATQILSTSEASDLHTAIQILDNIKIEWGWGPLLAHAREQANLPAWIGMKILGFIITAVAVSQGSSFWYDTLRRFKGEAAPSAGAG